MIQLSYILNDSEIVNINKVNMIPNKSGIYKFYGDNYELLYIGKAKYLKTRIKQHLGNNRENNTKLIKHNFKKVNYILIEDPVDRDIIETYLINLLKPKLNISKVYTYISEYGLNKYKTKDQIKQEQIRQLELNEVYLSLNL